MLSLDPQNSPGPLRSFRLGAGDGVARQAVALAAVALAYFVTSKFGFTLAFAARQVTVVWPPTGIALAALLLLGPRATPAVFLGAFLANAGAQEPLWVALCIACGNTLEAYAGAKLLQRFAGFQNDLGRLKDVRALVFLAAALATAISATVGVTALAAGGVQPWAAYKTLWFSWWLGDAGGALLVAPALLVWMSRACRFQTLPVRLEWALLLAGLTVACAYVFFGQQLAGSAFAYVVFLFVIWAALRFGQHGATAVALVASVMAVWATSLGAGPFQGMTEEDSLVALQIFMMTVAATGLFLSAAVGEVRGASEQILNYTRQLERSNQELDDFAYIASHDLKEPLRGITIQASFLMQDYKEKLGQEGVRRLGRLVEISQRMDRLITDLLYFSRLGRTELAVQETDLNKVIDDIRRLMQTALTERRAHISVPAPLPRIVCDKPRVTEAFRNLITNAVKYSDKPEPRVEIGYHARLDTPRGPRSHVFYVKDDGVGIDPRYHEEIFRIFKRIRTVPEETDAGTGVGLTFVKKIVERHGGHIWLDSRPGQGATFYFTLERSPP